MIINSGQMSRHVIGQPHARNKIYKEMFENDVKEFANDELYYRYFECHACGQYIKNNETLSYMRTHLSRCHRYNSPEFNEVFMEDGDGGEETDSEYTESESESEIPENEAVPRAHTDSILNCGDIPLPSGVKVWTLAQCDAFCADEKTANDMGEWLRGLYAQMLQEFKIGQECEICLMHQTNFISCNQCKHKICEHCYTSLKKSKCPYCRKKIRL